MLYTLVATCKRLRIDPFAYLQDVFTRMPEMSSEDMLRDILPERWIQKHPEHRSAHREKEASQAKQRRRERRTRCRLVEKAKATQS